MSSERQEDNTASPWWGEHIHRYSHSVAFIGPGASVLDLACGEGFGTNYIHESCRPQNIIGGDLSDEAIAISKKKYPALDFRKLDGTKTGFADHTFTHVVSFETIEHTTLYKEMLAEFHRILRPNGCLILSTPNIKINSPGGVVRNPYHTQEFDYGELDALLKPLFGNYTIYGQQYIRYKNKGGFKKSMARLLERFFYLRGIRKTPLGFKNGIFRKLIGKDFYPGADDYAMTSNRKELMQCKTFYAICTK